MTLRDRVCSVNASGTVVRLDSGPENLGREVQRFDAGTLAKAERTPQGGYVLNADLTRSGIFVYPDGIDYRPPEEVAKADSLATLEGAPVTLLHPTDTPDGLITPQTFRRNSRGQATAVRWDSEKSTVQARLLAQDAELISAIESGTREVSCGYKCRLDMTPGVAPDGTKYDRVQRNIRYNHVAVVPYGRAHESGTPVAIRLDSAGNQLPPSFKKATIMDTIRIDGVDYPLSTPAEVKAAKAAHERWVTKVEGELKTRADAASQATARADAADATVTKLKGELAQATDPARLDAAISARTELQAQAVAILGKDEAAKLDHGKLKTAIIAKVFPAVKLDGKDAAYLDAMYDAAIAAPKATPVAQANASVANALSTKTDSAVKTDSAMPMQPVKRPHEMPLVYSKDAR